MFRTILLNFNNLYVRPTALVVAGVEFKQKFSSIYTSLNIH
jgi:hypothetical protein